MDKLMYGEKRALIKDPLFLEIMQKTGQGIIFLHNTLLYEERTKYYFWKSFGYLKSLAAVISPEFTISSIKFDYFLNAKHNVDEEISKRIDILKKEFRYSSYFDFNYKLKPIKEAHPWLKNILSCHLDTVPWDLDVAIKNYKKTGFGFPKYKKIDPKNNLAPSISLLFKKNASQIKTIKQYNHSKKIKQIKFKFNRHLIEENPKKTYDFINIRFIDHRNLETLGRTYSDSYRIVMSKGKNLSISFISYKEKNIIAKPVKNVVAIDRNANKDNILYLDNGFKFRPPSNKKGLILEQLEKKRIKLSKQLTIKYDQNKKLRYDKDNKKWYLTKNYLKLVEKINKVYEKQQNVRKHYHHFATHHIVRRYDKVIIEDLDIKKMTESNKGNELLHGKDVKIQSELNRKVLNAALGQNKIYLDYKTKYKGKKLIEIDPKNTSITCTECGNVNKKNRKKRDIFKCIKCGYTNHADFVSAINIKSKS